MNFLKEYFSDKKYGFYVTLACMLLSVITSVVYVSIYSSTRFMSWAAFAFILVGVVLTAGLIAFKQYRFAPALMLATNFVGLLFYVYYIYFFVSSVMVGIQFSGFPPEFIINVIFFVLMLVASVVCVFMPQADEKQEKEVE